MSDAEILSEAKRIAPWFWPTDPWSIDLSCKQGQQRTLSSVRETMNQITPQGQEVAPASSVEKGDV